MVRINIISPKKLADQHLIAEYNEMLMFMGYVEKYPSFELAKTPKKYCLGTGHILFFKNKLNYIKKRHELLKKEMKKRGFHPYKTINISEYPKSMRNDWQPKSDDKKIIKKRLLQKIGSKPDFYRYCGKYPNISFFKKLIS